MKNIYNLIFLFSLSCFSQNTYNFSVENKSLEWSYIFELKTGENVSLLKNNLSLDFKTDSTGISKNQNVLCNGISIYTRLPFDFNFRIESKDSRYKVVISNIIFNDNLNFGNNTTTKIESYTLSNNLTIKQNNQNLKNLNCLNEYFLTNFTIQPQKSNW